MSGVGDGLGRVDAVIAARAEEHIRRIQQFLQAPHSGPGMRETAQIVRVDLERLGCQETAVHETPGNPIIFGSLQVGAPATLIVYLMYDTAPVLDAASWTHPPFAGELADLPVGRSIIGRGSMARRGPAIAFLEAVQALKDAGLPLPVNMLFVAEGDENIGSPYLANFFAAYRDRLASASATVFPSAAEEADGSAIVRLGAKGMLGLELTCDGATWGHGPGKSDLHWANAGWVESPMWRLAHAIATLSTPDGSKILIDGFYDNVAPLDGGELDLVRSLPFDEDRTKAELGISVFAGSVRGWEALKRNLYEPVLSLQGVWGSAPPISRLYKKAIARLDIRTIWNQTADEIEDKVRQHLARRGLGDIAVRRFYALPSSKVPAEDPVVQAALATYNAYGIQPQLWPSQPRTPPTAVFERPHVMFGVGHGGNQAARNEYLLIKPNGRLHGLHALTRSFAEFLMRYGALRG